MHLESISVKIVSFIMDYCAALSIVGNKRNFKNVFSTLFYPIKVDSYFQQHNIFEIIGELMIRIAIDRPSDTIDYSIRKLLEIASKYKRIVMTIEFANCTEDASRMLKKLSCQSHIPIIECAKEDANWRRLLTSSSLGNHHFIICDFKSTTNDQKRMKIMQKSSSNECRSPSKVIDVRLCEENLKQVLHDVRLMKPAKVLAGEWNRRIFVVGRVGSGRRTHAALIAQQFGLIFIDFDYMKTEYEQQCSSESKTLSNDDLSFWGFAQRTILKPNCLRNGYICTSNVISKEKLQILMEKFIYPPNQIIFLHTNEANCRRRILSLRRRGICAPYQAALAHESLEAFLDHQMKVYELHKREFAQYFQGDKRKLILHVDSNGKVDDTKNCLFSHINNKLY